MLKKIRSALLSPSRPDLEHRLNELRNKKIVIYGAGSFGKEMLSLFRTHKINVSAFLDKNAEKLILVCGETVYTLENYPYERKDTVVVFSIVCDKDMRRKIIDEIKNSGFENVTEAQSLRCLYVNYSNGYTEDTEKILEKISAAYKLLSDEKSRQIFVNNVYAHLTGDYSRCCEYEDAMDKQYFPDDIDLANGYNVFVDCGGFTGDTVQAVLSRKKCKKLFSFEPSIDNYKMLADTCEKYALDTEFALFNSAVSDKISQLSFKSGTGSGSLSSDGNILVSTVPIDKAIIGIKPTFIKMDIEGEEINALNGAANTIRKYTPDMAICVYHNIEHIWEIPLLIDSINNSYSFYLRSYNSYTMETVLYAVKKNELKGSEIC